VSLTLAHARLVVVTCFVLLYKKGDTSSVCGDEVSQPKISYACDGHAVIPIDALCLSILRYSGYDANDARS
jgi:hypothetical protein